MERKPDFFHIAAASIVCKKSSIIWAADDFFFHDHTTYVQAKENPLYCGSPEDAPLTFYGPLFFHTYILTQTKATSIWLLVLRATFELRSVVNTVASRGH